MLRPSLCSRAHKEVLYFASAFFQAALCGGWAETEKETGRPQSVSSVITISQPPSVPGGKPTLESYSEITFAPMDPDMDPDELDLDMDINSGANDIEPSSEDKAKAREDSLNKLEKSSPTTPTSPSESGKAKAPDVDGKVATPSTPTTSRLIRRPKEKEKRPDAIIVLKEERVCAVVIQMCGIETNLPAYRLAPSMTSSNMSIHSTSLFCRAVRAPVLTS